MAGSIFRLIITEDAMGWFIVIFLALGFFVVGIAAVLAIFNRDISWLARILSSLTGVFILWGAWNAVGWLLLNLK